MVNKPDNLNEQLSAFLDGELPPAETEELERRLALDPALRIELEQLAQVKRLVGQLPRVKAPASIRAAVREHLERRSLLNVPQQPADRLVFRFRLLRIVSAAAAFLIVASISYLIHVHTQPSDEIATNPPVPPVIVDRQEDADSPMARLARNGTLADGDADESLRVSQAPPLVLSRPDLGYKGNRLVRRNMAELDAAKTPTPDKAQPSKAEAILADAKDGRDSAPLADRFKKGAITAGEVRSLSFADEPIVLNIQVADEARQKAVADRFRKTLSRNNAVPVEQLDSQTELTVDDHQFYFRGRKDKNFSQQPGVNQVQILVRVPREVAEKLAVQATKEADARAEVKLREHKVDSEAVRRQLNEGAALGQIVRREQAVDGRSGGGASPGRSTVVAGADGIGPNDYAAGRHDLQQGIAAPVAEPAAPLANQPARPAPAAPAEPDPGWHGVAKHTGPASPPSSQPNFTTAPPVVAQARPRVTGDSMGEKRWVEDPATTQADEPKAGEHEKQLAVTVNGAAAQVGQSAARRAAERDGDREQLVNLVINVYVEAEAASPADSLRMNESVSPATQSTD